MLNKSQFEIETELKECFKHSLIREIHIRTGIGEKWLGHWLNPDHHAESPQYRTLQIQTALDELDPVEGERHFQRFCRMRQEALQASDMSVTGRVTKAVERVEADISELKVVMQKLPGVEWQDDKKKKK